MVVEKGFLKGYKDSRSQGVWDSSDDQNPPSDSPLTKGGYRGVVEKCCHSDPRTL
jgi:hypothetical protein